MTEIHFSHATHGPEGLVLHTRHHMPYCVPAHSGFSLSGRVGQPSLTLFVYGLAIQPATVTFAALVRREALPALAALLTEELP